MTKGI
jgi:4-hydroxysphinganine ceramide fatty acyl 2-hydroxylase